MQMNKIYKIYPIGFAANSYLITADGNSAVAVDPAQPRILDEAKKRGLEVKYVLLTHGHFDHIGGCAALQAAGAKVGCLEAERALATGKNNLAEEFGVPMSAFTVDFTFRDGDQLDLCGIHVRVVATPGHTAGGCCYYIPAEHVLISGDTLFHASIGRTDLPTGSSSQLVRSVREKLMVLPEETKVYPGHMEETTIGYEKKYNPFV